MNRRVKVQDSLNHCGIKMKAPEFKDYIYKLFKEKCPDYTEDEIGFHPLVALDFCNHVRFSIQSPALPDHIILRTVMNYRKAHLKNEREENAVAIN